MSHLCKFCGYYEPLGRRGGYCSLLNVPVCGKQTVCCLATPVFPDPVAAKILEPEFLLPRSDSPAVGDRLAPEP